MLKNYAFVPARSGSQRVKNKNLIEINGHPLIAYTINSAKATNLFTDIIVSTDSQIIFDVAQEYGATNNGLRSREISESKSPDIEWVLFELEKLPTDQDFLITILRPTNPLRNPATISRAITEFIEADIFDSLRAMRKVKEHPGKMWRELNVPPGVEPYIKTINETTGTHNYSSPMQTLEPLLVQDASLEITRASSIHEHRSISGVKVMKFIMPNYEGFDLNYPEDFDYLNFLISTKKIKLPNLRKLRN
jgi:CMP-N-acetylneuraminic acid synthetase